MAEPPGSMGDFKWNMEAFSDAYRRYTEVSKRAPAQICNNKAYFIARKASWFTSKTSRAAIADSLGSRVSGRLKLRPGTSAGNEDAPLAALIIQAARARKGLPGLYGAEMEAAIQDLISRRLSSISFLRSGWLPAIRILARFAQTTGAPPIGDATQFGPDAGTSHPALTDWNAVATIINYAVSQSRTSRQTNYAGFKREGDLGVAKAFEDETASMEQYIEDHLRPDAEEFNRRAA